MLCDVPIERTDYEEGESLTPEQLQAWRHRHRLLQSEVAEVAQRSVSAVRSWEAGRAKVPFEVVRRIARQYPDLLTRTDDASSSVRPAVLAARPQSVSDSLRSAKEEQVIVVVRPEGVSDDDWRRMRRITEETERWLLEMADRSTSAVEAAKAAGLLTPRTRTSTDVNNQPTPSEADGS